MEKQCTISRSCSEDRGETENAGEEDVVSRGCKVHSQFSWKVHTVLVPSNTPLSASLRKDKTCRFHGLYLYIYPPGSREGQYLMNDTCVHWLALHGERRCRGSGAAYKDGERLLCSQYKECSGLSAFYPRTESF
jgi:hypothetical protein